MNEEDIIQTLTTLIEEHDFTITIVYRVHDRMPVIAARLKTNRQRGFDLALSRSIIQFYELDGLKDIAMHHIENCNGSEFALMYDCSDNYHVHV
jgi:hypothetical protein